MGFGASDGACNTGLVLGLGMQGSCRPRLGDHHLDLQPRKKKLCLKYDHLLPSLTLGPPEEGACQSTRKTEVVEYNNNNNLQAQASSLSAVSSFSTDSSGKKEKEIGGCDDVEVERVISSRISDEDDDGSPRKKLRLNKEQSAILENCFKEHITLNPKQKQALAEQLNLRPRQVEVWFQNRRARTKLKQTEVDCELLKKCCETLTEENKRLQKELKELKSLKVSAPLYMQMPAATLSICPSCERIVNGSNGSSTTTTSSFIVEAKPHFYNSLTTHPSAAC